VPSYGGFEKSDIERGNDKKRFVIIVFTEIKAKKNRKYKNRFPVLFLPLNVNFL